MNIFIIHSGKDRERVEEQFSKRLKAASKSTEVLVLGNGGFFWKFEAGKKIKKAQIVLFALGKTSAQSKNIDWEITTALRYNKSIFVVRLDKDAPMPQALFRPDEFSNQIKLRAAETSDIGEVIEKIRKYEKGEYDVFNRKPDDSCQTEIMEQYKLFLNTSENLVARRQSVNNFYLTTNAVLVSMIAAIGKVKEGDWGALSWAVVLIGAIGIIISLSWRKLLEAYGTLNACKMKVINQIEEKLPLNLYKAEWDVMSDKLNNRRYVSFTDNEKRLPAIFMVLYIAAIGFCAAAVAIHRFGPHS